MLKSWVVRWVALVSLVASVFAVVMPGVGRAAGIRRPKLILVLVFDQFRADYLTRFESRFLPAAGAGGTVGGFRYFMDRGAYYPFAQYDVLQNMTCVGHSTILSGAHPYRSGIPLNYWYDRARGTGTYCVEDPETQRSPRNFAATTVGDELKNAGYPSRVVSLALKDRAAILLGGHRPDVALWFDGKARKWVTSKYYAPEAKLPAWAEGLNTRLAGKEPISKAAWKSVGAGSGLSANPEFSHDFADEAAALVGPEGTRLTEEAAEAALDSLSLGHGKATDLLAVSFSNHDLAGHAYGPNSRELEELTVTEDRAVARLLNHVRSKLGLQDTVIVLTADHGSPPLVEYAKASGYEAGRIDNEGLKKILESKLDDAFGKPGKGMSWIGAIYDLNIYVNPRALADRKADARAVENLILSVSLQNPGIAGGFTLHDYEAGRLPPEVFRRKIELTYVPSRNGDVVLFPKPYYYPGEHAGGLDHMSLYNYDATVPLALAGFGIRPGLRSEAAKVVDIAPTLSFLSGVLPPSLSEGRVLSEAISGAMPSTKQRLTR